MEARPFAHADIFRHPPMSGHDLPPALAAIRKNESSCVVILSDGTWLCTWSQGSSEGAVDERIVCATSSNLGLTWSAARQITASAPTVRRSYGCPFVVPGTGRLYLFLHEGYREGAITVCNPEIDAGNLAYLWSDDNGTTWSEITLIRIPDRDISAFPDKIHAHLNHPPQIMPGGQVVLPFTQGMRNGAVRRFWQLGCCEASLLWCENLLTETDPSKLRFSLLPPGSRGIRANIMSHGDNPAVLRLAAAYGGHPEEIAANAQELTVVPLSDGRWFGVVRTYLGSPGYTVSSDEGRTWTPVERLRYGPEGEYIEHPHTMCPIARLPDGRLMLLFTNNDGTRKGAAHVWDGGCRTRNPQWFVIGREIPGETRNGGLLFGPPRILASVDETSAPDGFTASTATGISMPQYLHANGRHFVQYGLKKEHILLDEIPAAVIDEMTPPLPE
ncbi:MAG: glycoside hydrolase [Cephaloticoccus sp.]|nr:glycoside hydrolase [Cephaloticoccus sp.]